jgi:hypothetical protein
MHLVATQSDALDTLGSISDELALHLLVAFLVEFLWGEQVPLEYILDALVRLLVPLDGSGRMATKLDVLP